MRIYKKQWRKLLLLAGVSMAIAFFSMAAYAGYHYVRAGNEKGKHVIKKESIQIKSGIKEEDGVCHILSKNGKIVIDLDDVYINKLTYRYDSDGFFFGDIFIYGENIYGEQDQWTIQDAYMRHMPRSVVNVGRRVSKIEIEFHKTEKEDLLSVSDFGIDNSLKWNPLIFVFCFTVIFVIVFLIVFREENAQMPAVAAFLCILTVSTCLLFLQPPYATGFDEKIHFVISYQLGVTDYGEWSTTAIDYIVGNEISFLPDGWQGSIEERIDMIRVLQEFSNTPGIIEDEYRLGMSSVGYLFQALALKTGNFLHLPFYIAWLMGKFSNVLLYAIVISLAIYIVPIGKRLLAVIAMLPTMIFQSTVYTYDVTVVAFLILGICILLREMIEKERVFSWRWRILFVLCIVLGCLPKAVYAPLILCGVFLGKEKFYSQKDAAIFRSMTGVIFVLLMSSFVLPTLLNPPEVADVRGGDTSTARQLHYVLGKPLAYAAVLLKNFFATAERYVLSPGTSFAHLSSKEPATFCTALLIGVAVTDTYGRKEKDLSAKQKIIAGTAMTLVTALIWTALYLSFTEVGKTTIAGVQPRYYLPFLFLFYLCFQSKKIVNHIPVKTYQMWAMLLSLCIVLKQIYDCAFVFFCI